MKKLSQILIILFSIVLMIIAMQYVQEYDQYNEIIISNNDRIDALVFLDEKEFSSIQYAEGMIYVGGNDGVYTIDVNHHEITEIMNGQVAFSRVRSIVVDEFNQLWIGHKDGVSVYDGKEVIITYKKNNGLIGENVNDLFIGVDGIYVATFKGVSLINKDVIYNFAPENGLQKPIIKVLYEDVNKRLWAGSYMSSEGGVTIVTEGMLSDKTISTKYLTMDDGLSHHAITSFLETDEGMWVGSGTYTEGGSALFDLETFQLKKSFSQASGLIGGKVRYMFKDFYGNIWFCSESDGIAILRDNSKFTYLTTKDGLSDNETKEMTYDNFGNLWLATRRGVTYISSKWLESHLYNDN